MNLHEYQAKLLLMQDNIPVPPFGVVSQLHEVDRVLQDLNLTEAVVKIQVHAGGRGRAGGVKLARSPEEIRETCRHLLGMKMVNEQTGKRGVIARKVLISAPVNIAREYYLGATVDRNNRRGVLIASQEGGVAIEEVAEKWPEKIVRVPIELNGKIRPYHMLRVVKAMGWTGEIRTQGSTIIERLARMFVTTDASLVEINPLVLSEEGNLWALDAKLSIDDNGLFRQHSLASMEDVEQKLPAEVAAHAHGLAYVGLEGNIGCMVNGAGLAMATMDIIHSMGGKPANFLDVGGTATEEKIGIGFQILASDPQVKAIFVNIFGGIMSCATIVKGIMQVLASNPIPISVIVRMEGTEVAEGKRLLEHSGLPLFSADSLEDGARKAVEEAARGHLHQ